MRPALVVVDALGFDEPLGLGQAAEPVVVQALVAELADQVLGEGVLRRPARLNAPEPHAAPLRPPEHGSISSGSSR